MSRLHFLKLCIPMLQGRALGLQLRDDGVLLLNHCVLLRQLLSEHLALPGWLLLRVDLLDRIHRSLVPLDGLLKLVNFFLKFSYLRILGSQMLLIRRA